MALRARTAGLLLPLALAGCAVPPGGDGADAEQLSQRTSRSAREHDMNVAWRGHTLSQLKAALGEPVRMLEIPGGGNPPGFVMVYPKDPGSGCVDSFALLYGRDPVIRLYQCR